MLNEDIAKVLYGNKPLVHLTVEPGFLGNGIIICKKIQCSV